MARDRRTDAIAVEDYCDVVIYAMLRDDEDVEQRHRGNGKHLLPLMNRHSREINGTAYPSRRDCTSWATDPQDRANGSAIPAGGKQANKVRRRGEEAW